MRRILKPHIVVFSVVLMLLINVSCTKNSEKASKTSSNKKSPELALTPPMGLNTWNYFGYEINDSLIREIIDAMVSTGLRDAGYTYVCLDDGWQANRSERSGALEYDKEKFPNGIKPLADTA